MPSPHSHQQTLKENTKKLNIEITQFVLNKLQINQQLTMTNTPSKFISATLSKPFKIYKF